MWRRRVEIASGFTRSSRAGGGWLTLGVRISRGGGYPGGLVAAVGILDGWGCG